MPGNKGGNKRTKGSQAWKKFQRSLVPNLLDIGNDVNNENNNEQEDAEAHIDKDIYRKKRKRIKGSRAWGDFQRSLVPNLEETDCDSVQEGNEQETNPNIVEESFNDNDEIRYQPPRKVRLKDITDDSDDSDDETERAKKKRAFKALGEKRSGNKTGSRIKGRPRDDDTDDEDEVNQMEINKSRKQLDFTEKVSNSDSAVVDDEMSDSDCSPGPSFPRKRKKVAKKCRQIVSDSESSDGEGGEELTEDSGEESDDSFIDNDEANESDSQEDGVDWLDMLENLKRRGDKFAELNSQYEESTHCRQLGGYDLSDDEERENKYPPKLLNDLREAVEAACEDDEVEVDPVLLNDNDRLIQRWEMYDVTESKEKEGECVCGRTGLRWLYFMRVKGLTSWPFHTRVVGSECIRWFCRGNPRSVLVVFNRLLKEGCVSTYLHQLDSKCLLFTLGGNMLPQFLREHKEFHRTEYTLPVEIHEEDNGAVDIIVKPGTRGRVKDEAGKLLVKDGKYQVWVRPIVRPCKNPNKIPVVDFVLVKVQDVKMVKEGVNREQTGKDFIK